MCCQSILRICDEAQALRHVTKWHCVQIVRSSEPSESTPESLPEGIRQIRSVTPFYQACGRGWPTPASSFHRVSTSRVMC